MALAGAARSTCLLVYFAAAVKIWLVAWRRTDAEPGRRFPE